MKQRQLHLICNAHLDPVWLWEWEEGAAEAMSTFRIAADLCEEFDGFIFNHNEAFLYQWIEEYEPTLVKRIQKLVKQGKWHIMGGWMLQPDCNMPSGESFVRQGLLGKTYFKEKFGVEPRTAINMDPFGHSRGLVQIFSRLGYDSYIVARPNVTESGIADNDFVWVGLDGSEIQVHRCSEGYGSGLGQARKKVESWLANNSQKDIGLVLWGIGNHGGGPSYQDLRQLKQVIAETKDRQILHSTPEGFFAAVRPLRAGLPRLRRDLNPSMVGCYTSQIRIKQKHRLLENELYMVEKMASAAAINGLLKYPADELRQALYDLMFSEFHDILPGSSIQPVEDMALRTMDHGLEIASRVKARSFFALASGQPKAKEGEIPILVFNPHPFAVKGVFECEFQPANQNWKDEFSFPAVFRNGERIPCQAEKEASNLNLDWRKRVVFAAELLPMQMNRFDVHPTIIPKKPVPTLKAKGDAIRFKTDDLEFVINTRTGLVDKFRTKDGSMLKAGAMRPIVIEDNEDPWGMTVKSFRKQIGEFTLLSKAQAAEFAGVRAKTLDPVRVIEEGEARTVIEVLLGFNHSFICQRYKLPQKGTQVEVEVRVHWNEKNRMLKLSVPTVFKDADYVGQVAYGVQDLPADGNEAVAQKWVAVDSKKAGLALTCINDGVYGSDFKDGELRISLIRSAAYSGHPILDRPILPQDRYLPRIDQGERLFSFWFNAGKRSERLGKIECEALACNEKPFALSFFPNGGGKKIVPSVILEDKVVQLAAFKPVEKGDGFIVRLFEPTGRERSTVVHIPPLKIRKKVTLGKFEIKTFRVNAKSRTMKEVGLMEK